MTTPGKLHVDTTDGRIHGPATITYNSPFPCVNGTPGVTGAIRGVVMHTMVGNLPGTIATFNNPKAEASAHFGSSDFPFVESMAAAVGITPDDISRIYGGTT